MHVKSRKDRLRVYRGTPGEVALLARALRRGELVAVPTETVYGLAANALDARACRRIFRAKRRPANDPLIVHLGSAREAERVAVMNAAAKRLAVRFWPGPLTLVLPKRPIVPDVVTAGLPSVAIRVPNHPLFQRLLRSSGLPLAAPSANPSGYVSPTTAAHVISSLGGRVAHVLDGGPSKFGVESTIVDMRDPDDPRLLRPGAIGKREIERVLRQRLTDAYRQSRGMRVRGAQLAPGMLSRHYSPRTRVVLHKTIRTRDAARAGARDAWLFFAKPGKGILETLARSATGKTVKRTVRWLDASGNPRRAARQLYAILRELDSGQHRLIHAEMAPAGAIGDAINDRLMRASTRR